MSVLAEAMEPSKHFPDNPFDLPEVDGDTLMDIGLGPDLVDPQLTMLYPGQQPRERPPDPFASSSFLWDTPMDGTLSLFESAVPSQDDAADLAALAADVGGDNGNESASPLSSAANLSSRRTSKASRTSSKSSVPSLSSASASSSKKRVRKPSRKKQESQTSSSLPAAAAAAAAAASPVQVKREPSSGGEEDAKRTKYLERNRVAASKCRQKKKEWVHELEESKAEMEARHVELQREYGVLLGEVSMIKNMLMRHAACKDPNIDQWIGLEAKKFVQKSSHDSQEKEAEAARRLSLSQQSLSLTHSTSASASASRRASLAESLNPLSPAASPLQFQTSPVIKMEDINYDHMPDDMFD